MHEMTDMKRKGISRRTVLKGSAAAAGIAAHALANVPLLGFGLALLGRERLTLGKVARMTGEEPQEVGT